MLRMIRDFLESTKHIKGVRWKNIFQIMSASYSRFSILNETRGRRALQSRRLQLRTIVAKLNNQLEVFCSCFFALFVVLRWFGFLFFFCCFCCWNS